MKSISKSPVALLALACCIPPAICAANTGGIKSSSCACQALAYNFDIDCSDQTNMNQAIADLEANACLEECNSDHICRKNFLIIQAHHDYCLHEEVPEILETSIHIYENVCSEVHCDIKMKNDPNSRKCPPVDCETKVGDDAWQIMVANNCKDDCSTSDCGNNFRIIKAVHDKCPRDTLSTVVEIAYHDVDEACDAFGCNLASADDDMSELICTETSSPAAHTLQSSLLTGAAAVVGGMTAAAAALV